MCLANSCSSPVSNRIFHHVPGALRIRPVVQPNLDLRLCRAGGLIIYLTGLKSCQGPITQAAIQVSAANPMMNTGDHLRQRRTFGQTIDSAWIVVGLPGAGNINIYPSTETLYGSVKYNVPDGSQALDVTGDVDNGAALGVEQTINTTPGTTYDLSFEVGSTLGQPAIGKHHVNTIKSELKMIASDFEIELSSLSSPVMRQQVSRA